MPSLKETLMTMISDTAKQHAAGYEQKAPTSSNVAPTHPPPVDLRPFPQYERSQEPKNNKLESTLLNKRLSPPCAEEPLQKRSSNPSDNKLLSIQVMLMIILLRW